MELGASGGRVRRLTKRVGVGGGEGGSRLFSKTRFQTTKGKETRPTLKINFLY